jgi:DNA repair protein RadC
MPRSAVRTALSVAGAPRNDHEPQDLTRRRPDSRRKTPREPTPAERLLLHGAATLSDAEVLALALQAKGAQGLALARGLLREAGFGGLIGASPGTLSRKGLRGSRAVALLAAYEVATRLAKEEVLDRPLLNRPGELAKYLILKHCLPDQEILGALYLDVRHRLIADREIYRGTLDRATVEPRAILSNALLLGAAGLVVFHTHPSGDPSPSVEDHLFTRRLCHAAVAVGVEVLDHLIVTHSRRWVSLRQRGAWPSDSMALGADSLRSDESSSPSWR